MNTEPNGAGQQNRATMTAEERERFQQILASARQQAEETRRQEVRQEYLAKLERVNETLKKIADSQAQTAWDEERILLAYRSMLNEEYQRKLRGVQLPVGYGSDGSLEERAEEIISDWEMAAKGYFW